MPKFVCVDPDTHRANRPVEVNAKNKTEARKMMCRRCVPVCSGPDRVKELPHGQMSLFDKQ